MELHRHRHCRTRLFVPTQFACASYVPSELPTLWFVWHFCSGISYSHIYIHSYTLKESIIQLRNSTEHCSQRMAMARPDHLNTWILKCKRFCHQEQRQNNEVICVNRPGQAKWSNKSVEEIYTYKSPVCRPNRSRLRLLRSDRNRSCQRWCFKTIKCMLRHFGVLIERRRAVPNDA